ncbi:hypothetical protein WID27_17965 [Streptomyces sp. F41]|uniref:hypothetical protein n=1 Tax=Streptomyces TaxID=1883 RepID=UPI0013A6A837|nr:hypothetical protein [Streptomyces cadmiisoli]
MAGKVDHSRLDYSRSKPPGNAKYPWSSWATGEAWVATRGEDFDVDPNAFLMAARQWAKRHGFRVRAKVEGESVAVFQFLPVPEEIKQ